MLSYGRRSGANPSREIESEDRFEASRELNVSRQTEYMRQRRVAFRPMCGLRVQRRVFVTDVVRGARCGMILALFFSGPCH